MERQIPRSIQYSDLRPEVIENQVKLVRFTPQTNIQNQVPNDIVRFQLQGNGFYDPYSAYISMTVDFGEPADQFTVAGTAAPINSGVFEMQQMWEQVQTRTNGSIFDDLYLSEPYIQGTATSKVGCRLSDLELDHQNMIVRKSRDGQFGGSFTNSTSAINIYTTTVSGTKDDAGSTLGLPFNGDLQTQDIAQGTKFTTTPVLLANSLFKSVGCSSITSSSLNDSQSVGNSQISDEDRRTNFNTLITQMQPKDAKFIKDGTHKHIPIPGAEFKILDRSAHSFINRLVIRSQGTEIERIEQYDVVAGLLNDMIYSNEQAQFHSFEGFGGTPLSQQTQSNGFVNLQRSVIGNSVMGPRGRCGERVWGWAFVGVDEDNWMMQTKSIPDLTYDLDTKLLNGTLSQGPLQLTGIGNVFSRVQCNSRFQLEDYRYVKGEFPTDQTLQIQSLELPAWGLVQGSGRNMNGFVPAQFSFADHTEKNAVAAALIAKPILGVDATIGNQYVNPYKANFKHSLFHGLKNHPISWYVERKGGHCVTPYSLLQFCCSEALSSDSVDYFRPGQYRMTRLGQQTYEFAIPIYSGLIGVLMPEKKLLPLSLMPLEVDFTLNPHALIACYSQGYGSRLTRFYTMKRMEIYTHMIFFEQDVHRSMESIVAENGLFIHINTFYMAPVTVHPTDSVTQTIPINLHFKNINSIHMVHMYTNYLTRSSIRKLHFVSHNITSIQIRNGTDLIPSEPLRSDNIFQFSAMNQNVGGGRCTRLFIELLKAYNKMHDPMCDVALDPGLVYLSDCYADSSSANAVDFDISNDKSFSGGYPVNTNVPGGVIRQSVLCNKIVTLMGRATFNETFGASTTAANAAYAQKSFAGYVVAANSFAAPDQLCGERANCQGYARQSTIRSFIRMMRMGRVCANEQLPDGTPVLSGIHSQGSWGSNPFHIGNRPTIFFAPQMGSITTTNTQDLDYWGIPAALLKDKIQRFTALTGRCQIAMSLEGINLGVDNSLLCGKRGMIPFDIMFSGTKNDREQSMSLVFAKCDFIVYIRPDLVVTVLGK